MSAVLHACESLSIDRHTAVLRRVARDPKTGFVHAGRRYRQDRFRKRLTACASRVLSRRTRIHKSTALAFQSDQGSA